MSNKVAKVFLDANIFKFSAVKKHVYAKRRKIVAWGDFQKEIEYHVPYTLNDLKKIKTEIQRYDAISLGMLAYLGVQKKIDFYSHRIVDDEVDGLPSMVSPSGQFFNCPINRVKDPHVARARVAYGASRSHKEHLAAFISSINDDRFSALTRITGAFQGDGKPLNLNQALDAYHIWCAKAAKMDYFLTMDYKLKKVVDRNKQRLALAIVTPQELLRQEMVMLGFFKSVRIIVRAFRFARRELAFPEGEGWK